MWSQFWPIYPFNPTKCRHITFVGYVHGQETDTAFSRSSNKECYIRCWRNKSALNWNVKGNLYFTIIAPIRKYGIESCMVLDVKTTYYDNRRKYCWAQSHPRIDVRLKLNASQRPSHAASIQKTYVQQYEKFFEKLRNSINPNCINRRRRLKKRKWCRDGLLPITWRSQIHINVT